MTQRKISLSLVTLLLLAGCVEGKHYEATVQRTWPASGIRRISLREIDGTIRVEAGAPNEISLVAHVDSRGVAPKESSENKGFFRSTIEGDSLVLGRDEGHSVRLQIPFFNSPRLVVDYELRVPPATQMTLRTVNGEIRTIGVNGETSATTVNGGIDLDTAGQNEISARTVNGHVRAKFNSAFQGAKLNTVNGSVEAVLPPSASFACELSQVNGDFEATFPLSIHSLPGSRRVSGDVNGGRFPLHITTINGDIQVQTGSIPRIPAAPSIPPTPPALSRPSLPPAPPAAAAPPAPTAD
jgi:hypothetical protein